MFKMAKYHGQVVEARLPPNNLLHHAYQPRTVCPYTTNQGFFFFFLFSFLWVT